MSITYKRHPIDGNINCIGETPNGSVVFDFYLVGEKLSWVDVYSSEGKWRGRKIAEFKVK